MIVYIPNGLSQDVQLQGKSAFCSRLGHALLSMGVKVTDNPQHEADISLHIIRLKPTKSRIKIVRIDGVWHDTRVDYVKRNKGISESLHKSDAVVYQSQFSSHMGDVFLGKFKGPRAVIYNGADPEFFEKAKPVKVSEKNVFVAFSRWRPHKRLRDIIESFLLANIESSRLLVAGDLSRSGLSDKEQKRYFEGCPSISYLGVIDQNRIARYLKIACASIHLCWFDSCPNSVVEAITAKVPVISNNVGGTPELVRLSGGYVCNIDKPYDFKPLDLYHPKPIDRSIIAKAMVKASQKRLPIRNDHVLINEVAKQYLTFMHSLL